MLLASGVKQSVMPICYSMSVCLTKFLLAGVRFRGHINNNKQWHKKKLSVYRTWLKSRQFFLPLFSVLFISVCIINQSISSEIIFSSIFGVHVPWTSVNMAKKSSDHEPERDIHTTPKLLPTLHGPMQPIAIPDIIIISNSNHGL